MPYVGRELLRVSLEALNKGYSPLLIVSLPCMLSKGIPLCHSSEDAERAAFAFGAPDEREWLDSFFRPGGGPLGLPYYMPQSANWVEERYPDRTLQRRRKDFESDVFYHPKKRYWALRPSPGTKIKSRLLEGRQPIPLVALMAWLWRDRDIVSLSDALDKFVATYHFDREDLIPTVYTVEITPAFVECGLADSPLDQEAIAELIGSTAPAPVLPPYAELLARVSNHLEKSNAIPIPGLVDRILRAWLVGDIAVLLGPTGSGKTFIATCLVSALREVVGSERLVHLFLQVSKDTDSAQVVGYENLKGHYVPGSVVRDGILRGEGSDIRVLTFDEWNLAQIDAYLGPILSALESGRTFGVPGDPSPFLQANPEVPTQLRLELERGHCELPPDTFFIATCNSWVDEPESRLPLSAPVKRRCTIISLPNVLRLAFETHGLDGVAQIADRLLAQERDAVRARVADGHQSAFDSHRRGRLDVVQTLADVPERTRDKLLQISRVLLDNAETNTAFTVGILRDILLSIAYTEPGAEERVLGEQVADKILHQLQGDTQAFVGLSSVCADLPNASEIDGLLKRMGLGTGEPRMRPLL